MNEDGGFSLVFDCVQMQHNTTTVSALTSDNYAQFELALPMSFKTALIALQSTRTCDFEMRSTCSIDGLFC